MSTYNGRNAKITVNAATTEAVITEMGTWNVNRSADEIDTTAFGDGWGKSDVGMKKWNGSMSGFFDPEDTTGQKVLEDAYAAGSLISDIRFYIKYSTTNGEEVKYLHPDTATDANAGIRITSLDVSVDKSGVAQLSCNFSGSGPVKVTEETLSA